MAIQKLMKGLFRPFQRQVTARIFLLLPAILLAAVATSLPRVAGEPERLELKTAAFRPDNDIPQKFTCDGRDVSPRLAWNDAPSGTRSFALIVDDPDAPAGTWVHWVVFNLPATSRGLPEGVPHGKAIQAGGAQGRNDFPQLGYNGPCPPPGKPHRYFFKLYAVDIQLNLEPGATKKDVEASMRGHILAEAHVVGLYHR